jgi:hypothetical protein
MNKIDNSGLVYTKGKNALALLCYKPSKEWCEFLDCLKEDYSIYLICDDYKNKFSYDYLKSSYNFLNMIFISDNECTTNSFTHSSVEAGTAGGKLTLAWDKGLYYFSCLNTLHEYVWFIEDDVFIPQKNTLINLDKKYSEADLLCANHRINPNGFIGTGYTANNWIHWRDAVGMSDLPWYNSMVCVCRISKKLLCAISNHVKSKGRLFFLEILFNTIAHHNKLTILELPELRKLQIHQISGFSKKCILKDHFYHPFKDFNQQKIWRNDIEWEGNSLWFMNGINGPTTLTFNNLKTAAEKKVKQLLIKLLSPIYRLLKKYLYENN